MVRLRKNNRSTAQDVLKNPSTILETNDDGSLAGDYHQPATGGRAERQKRKRSDSFRSGRTNSAKPDHADSLVKIASEGLQATADVKGANADTGTNEYSMSSNILPLNLQEAKTPLSVPIKLQLG